MYVPGKINIAFEEPSLGREATAADKVLNSPAVVVPARTTSAPEGGVVREAPSTVLAQAKHKRAKVNKENAIVNGKLLQFLNL